MHFSPPSAATHLLVASDIDYETTPYLEVVIQVEDRLYQSASSTFTVTVTDRNEPPHIDVKPGDEYLCPGEPLGSDK